MEDKLRLSLLGDRLLGVPVADERQMAEIVLRRLPAPARMLAWPHLVGETELLATALRRGLAGKRRGINILLHGAPGTGKTEYARQLVGDIGAEGFAVSHMDDDGGEANRHERLQALRLCQTFAGEQGNAVLVLDEAEDVFQGDYNHPLARLFSRGGQSKAWMNALLEENEHPVVWISNGVAHLDPAYLRRFTYCLEFPASPLQVRREVAAAALEPLGCSALFIDAVAGQEDVLPALLASAAGFAKLCDDELLPERAVQSVLVQHAKAAGRALQLTMRPAETRYDLRYLNVGGEAAPERVIDALAGGTPAALMFSGPPGTGKTAFAARCRILARCCWRRAHRVVQIERAAPRRVGRHASPSVEPRTCSTCCSFDAADALLGARESAQQRVDRAVMAEFLRWLEAFEGVFACATNHVGDLRRRPDAAVHVSHGVPSDGSGAARGALRRTGAGLERGGESHPPLPASAADALRRLPELTAGDFANAARRPRLLRIDSVDAWLRELAAEHASKKSSSTQPIGFL